MWAFNQQISATGKPINSSREDKQDDSVSLLSQAGRGWPSLLIMGRWTHCLWSHLRVSPNKYQTSSFFWRCAIFLLRPAIRKYSVWAKRPPGGSPSVSSAINPFLRWATIHTFGWSWSWLWHPQFVGPQIRHSTFWMYLLYLEGNKRYVAAQLWRSKSIWPILWCCRKCKSIFAVLDAVMVNIGQHMPARTHRTGHHQNCSLCKLRSLFSNNVSILVHQW